jgi:putative methionine-R-sulfoxide reductase with GAF domain
VTGPDVALRSIMPAFEGVIPATIATASADGTPNITYISVARFLDEERIAISNQFFGKTTSNLGVNPFLAVRVADPETLLEYELDATHLRSERAGELFDSMRVQIDAIADQTGMRGVFRLRSVEVLRVDRCQLVEGSVGRLRQRTSGADALDGLSVFVGRLDDCRELGELTQTALELLDDLFGIGSSMLLMADHDLKSLFVVAHHGYASGVGAEITVDEGVIGVAAQRRRQVLVSHVTRAQNLNRAAARSRTEDRQEIPLPGLADAQSLLATPILLRGRLTGVLYVDSAEAGRFGTVDGQLIDVIARHIGMSIGLLDTTADDLSPGPRRAGTKPAADSGGRSITFHDPDGTVLIDGDYIIRGVAGRILFAMLSEYQRSGRVRFSNRELRLNRDIGLPAGNDNLDARLVTLRRRLAERGDPFQLQHAGRGQLELIVTSAVHVERNDLP